MVPGIKKTFRPFNQKAETFLLKARNIFKKAARLFFRVNRG